MVDWIDVRWRDRGEDSAYSIARIGVRVENTAGSLASIANIISRNGANISNLKITNRNPLYFELQIDLEVRDTQHLEHIIRALKVDSAVEWVERARGLDTDYLDGAPAVSGSVNQGVLI
jgi:(p)ppGpp synthase/HD superfamily hydrolase